MIKTETSTVCATERNLESTTDKMTSSQIQRNPMTTDSTSFPGTRRITGTLHMPGFIPHALVQDENLRREKAEESEVASRYKNSGQKDHKNAR